MTDTWRILIVDDDIDLGSSLLNILLLENFQVQLSHNHGMAVQALENFRPHLALIDIRLGTGSGIDLLAAMRRLQPKLFCIMMTGYASEETAIAALKEGARDYLRKPFEIKDLMLTLQRCLDRIQLEMAKNKAEDDLRKRNEEYRKLNQSLEDMVAQRTGELEKLHQDLLRQAHKAGMAEISTSILHNIGNILNSVITSSQFLFTHLDATAKRHALKRGLQKLSELGNKKPGEWQQQTEALVTFFERFGKLMDKEEDELRYHARRIEANIELIKKDILSQQRFATAGFQKESSDLRELVEDALAIQNTSCSNSGVILETDYRTTPKVHVQKYKMMHALVNILKNAWDSMDGNGILNISIFNDEQWAYIQIKDSGCGISPCNLEKIFRYGFTTKERGHGFGLHSSANAITEMGGALWAESEGVGQGSTMKIKIPVDPTINNQQNND